MSGTTIDPLPVDVQETLVRLAGSAGVAPVDVLRDALNLYACELEDRQATERAEQITPSAAELKVILALQAATLHLA